MGLDWAVIAERCVVVAYGYLNRRYLTKVLTKGATQRVGGWDEMGLVSRARTKRKRPASFMGICMILFRTGFFKLEKKVSPL